MNIEGRFYTSVMIGMVMVKVVPWPLPGLWASTLPAMPEYGLPKATWKPKELSLLL